MFLTFYGVIVLIYFFPLFMILPIYKSDSCYIMFYDNPGNKDYKIQKYMITT
jgi:hypothetical protein